MPLQRETVVRAALHLLDEVGLDGLTVRRLAAYLDIQNPTLYWHFTNKQELLNCMAEMIIADAFAELHPPEEHEDWADWLGWFGHCRGILGRNLRAGQRLLFREVQRWRFVARGSSATLLGITSGLPVIRYLSPD